MKKSLITLFALASVASAETTTPLLPDLKTQCEYLQKNYSYDKAWYEANCIGGGKSVTADMMEANFTASGLLLETGWHWALGNRNSGGNNFVPDNDGFQFTSEKGYNGIFVIATRKLSDFLVPELEKLTSLSISFVATGQPDIGFSAWVWDGTQATVLIEETKELNVDNGLVNEFTVKDLSLGSDATLLFLWNESSDFTKPELEKVNSVHNNVMSLTYSYTTAIIPEPTTATLTLLALAGLAARRRRVSL